MQGNEKVHAIEQVEIKKCTNITYFAIKRSFDLIVSLWLVVLTLPFGLLIALLIAVIDGRPIFFTQIRVGKNQKFFTIWKFRTMTYNKQRPKEHEYVWHGRVPNDFVFKSNVNPNVTKLGKFLRKYSLDELPQLLNVLRGEMSLVGPRPEIPQITKHYDDRQMKRLLVKPGITGYAQVNGRSEINHGKKIDYDLHYVKHCSFGLDMKIIFKTCVQVVFGKGAF